MKKGILPILAISLLCLIVIFTQSCSAGSGDTPARDSSSASAGTKDSVSDPLPSWNNGPLKTAIITFVTNATQQGATGFIPIENRIATFDNDGTLWAEKPYVQELFAFFRVKQMVAANPALAKKQPFKAVLEGDKAFFSKGGDKALVELVAATHTGMTEDQFESDAKEFASTVKYPGRNVALSQITYAPQLELLAYLRKNGFKTFIVTGGTIELVRSISQDLYGIPREQVVGTSFKYKFIDSTRSILREPALDFMNDKEGKPVAIQLHIGQRPVFACGNEGGAGDIAMLKYSQGNKLPSFQMIINHDDSTREFFYQEKDSASLKAAAKNNWHVVSMKNDWNKIYRE
ncbi:MAG: haloacid dehalogenase-like hydrolase [Bacteroidetes bacterium]|nr:MAG: haloacid dehalogenase-like hydrolase [Bacteroidota bacterium]